MSCEPTRIVSDRREGVKATHLGYSKLHEKHVIFAKTGTPKLSLRCKKHCVRPMKLQGESDEVQALLTNCSQIQW